MQQNSANPWEVMPVDVSDGPALVHVHQKAFVQGYTNLDEPAMGATPEALSRFVLGEFATRKLEYWGNLARQRSIGLHVARLTQDGAIVGFGSVQPGYVDSVYVLPKYQKIGIGTALLRSAMADYDETSYRIEVTRWSHAVPFYTKFGFRPTGREIPPPEPPLKHGIRLEQMEMVMHPHTSQF